LRDRQGAHRLEGARVPDLHPQLAGAIALAERGDAPPLESEALCQARDERRLPGAVDTDDLDHACTVCGAGAVVNARDRAYEPRAARAAAAA
jgi:hypothetical protein